MSKTKFLASILLAMAVLFAQVGMAAAAPLAQDATPATIANIETQTDANGLTTVLVTLQVEGQPDQTVRISLEYAIELGLIDPTTLEPVPLANVPADTVVDPALVIETLPGGEPAEDVHPIAAILASFFGEDSDVVNGYHQDGFGFGVIAQAMWMSRNLTGTEEEAGDASLAGDILQAKRDKDYEAFFEAHPEFGEQFGDEVPGNWGQFKKALKEKKNNLGVIVSGQADEGTEDPALQENPGQQNQDHGNQDKDKGKGKDKDKKNKKKP
jgi:hypothetical protein